MMLQRGDPLPQSQPFHKSFSYCFQPSSTLSVGFGEAARVPCNRRCCSLAKTQPTAIMQAHCRGYKPEPHDSTLQAGAPWPGGALINGYCPSPSGEEGSRFPVAVRKKL